MAPNKQNRRYHIIQPDGKSGRGDFIPHLSRVKVISHGWLGVPHRVVQSKNYISHGSLGVLDLKVASRAALYIRSDRVKITSACGHVFFTILLTWHRWFSTTIGHVCAVV